MKNASQSFQNRLANGQDVNLQQEKNHIKEQESRLIRSYGRIKSRKLSEHKNHLLHNLFSSYQFSLEDFEKNNKVGESLSNKLSAGFKKISFEIGFGFGDFLYEKAKVNPDQIFLGCEPHINGVVNILAKLENQPLPNIKISREDARQLLLRFDDNLFDEIYILFPDPWPKAKHFKRRLINIDLLDNLLAQKLKIGAKLIIATDHDSYKTWILSAILKSSRFKWNVSSKRDWQSFPDDWIVTKYQKKAQIEGRDSVIFNLTKIN